MGGGLLLPMAIFLNETGKEDRLALAFKEDSGWTMVQVSRFHKSWQKGPLSHLAIYFLQIVSLASPRLLYHMMTHAADLLHSKIVTALAQGGSRTSNHRPILQVRSRSVVLPAPLLRCSKCRVVIRESYDLRTCASEVKTQMFHSESVAD